MKFNGNEKLKGIFGEKVEAYFSAEKYQNSDIWFIDDVDDLNLFNVWFGAQEFKISDVINNVAVVTTMDYESFNDMARAGLTYVLKVNVEGQSEPISGNNLLLGWKALFTPVLGEMLNGSASDKTVEILISQALFSEIVEIKSFLSDIPQIKDVVSSFVSSKKTELSQKVSDLNDAVGQSEVLQLNEDLSALMEEKDNSIASLTEQLNNLKTVAQNLLDEKNSLESEKESWSTEKEELSNDLDSRIQKIEELTAEIDGLHNLESELSKIDELHHEIEEKDKMIAEQTQALENCAGNEEKISSLNEALEAKDREIEEQRVRIEEQNSKISELANNSESEEKITSLNEALEVKTTELKEKESIIQEKESIIQEKESEIEEKNKQLQERDTDLQSKIIEIEELKNQDNGSEKIFELEASLEELKRIKENLETEKVALEEEKTSLEKEKVSLEEQLQSAGNNKELEGKIEVLEQEKAGLETRITELEEALKSSSENANKILESEKEELASKVKEIEEEKSLLEKKLEHALKDVGNKDELLSKVEGDHNTTQLLDKIETQSSKLAEYKAIISEMKEKERPKKNGLQIKTASTLFGNDLNSEELKKELERLQNEVKSKDARIQELIDGKDVNVSLEQENSELRVKLEEAESRLAELNAKIGETDL